MEGLVHCSANFIPLTPISFLQRAATVYRDKTSIVYGTVRFSWERTYERCVKVASAIVQLGISPGDIVSSFCLFPPIFYVFVFMVMSQDIDTSDKKLSFVYRKINNKKILPSIRVYST